jgi:hypothetical protein
LANFFFKFELAGLVWERAEESNGRLVHFSKIFSAPNSHYSLQQAATSNPASSVLKKKFAKQPF